MNPQPGEIWLADLGLAAKTRPIVIVSRQDPPTIAAAAVGMLAVGALACSLPALRSSQVDPISVLRSD